MKGLLGAKSPSLQNLSSDVGGKACPCSVHKFRLVILGSSRVGKTALVARFLNQPFPDRHRPTVEEMHATEVTIHGVKVLLELLDTSGTYEFPAMRRLAFDQGDAFCLVYALDDPESFEGLRYIQQSLFERRQNPRTLIVANKADLQSTNFKEVTETVVRLDWELPFVECSAMKDAQLAPAFSQLLMELISESYSLGEIGKETDKKAAKRRKSMPPANLHQLHPKTKPPLTKRHSCVIS